MKEETKRRSKYLLQNFLALCTSEASFVIASTVRRYFVHRVNPFLADVAFIGTISTALALNMMKRKGEGRKKKRLDKLFMTVIITIKSRKIDKLQ